MSTLSNTCIYPQFSVRQVITNFPASASNPLNTQPSIFNYPKGSHNTIEVIRRTGTTVNYWFQANFTGGNSNNPPNDPNHYVSYLIGTAVQNFPSPGTALVVDTFPSYNYYIIETNDNNGGTNRQYTIQFYPYNSILPTIRLSAGDALLASDIIDVKVTYTRNKTY